ncbi:BnaC01g42270D [Brassica napus]|uniref:BnaC01g42270D protein n=1 Tax=Brassica napus TaxID=3708 RepID=A0A078DCU8_BRANA|nr:BnaC01g42270D [Brassica napus]
MEDETVKETCLSCFLTKTLV